MHFMFTWSTNGWSESTMKWDNTRNHVGYAIISQTLKNSHLHNQRDAGGIRVGRRRGQRRAALGLKITVFSWVTVFESRKDTVRSIAQSIIVAWRNFLRLQSITTEDSDALSFRNMRSTKICHEKVYDMSFQTFDEHLTRSQQSEKPRDSYSMRTALFFEFSFTMPFTCGPLLGLFWLQDYGTHLIFG